MRIHKIITAGIIGIFPVSIIQAQPSSSQNYIVTSTIKKENVTTEAQVNNLPIASLGKSQSVVYFDGFARPIQTIAVQGSPSKKDIIFPVVYDSFGREAKKYLPYVTGGNTHGGYQSGWQSDQASFYTGSLQAVDTSNSPYSQTMFESSPLNRVLAQGAPGTPWQPNLSNAYDTNRRVIKIKYEINVVSDSIRIFNVDTAGGIISPSVYGAGLLYIRTLIDENNSVTKEYTDKSGHVILKRVYLQNDSLQTYYIYDDFDRLRAVIQPEGAAGITGSTWTPPTGFINKWAFLYRYDNRNRLVMKKIPGADSVLMVYDQWDRLVLTQDGRQRSANQWLFTKYDALNRPAVTGSFTDTSSPARIRAILDTASLRYEVVDTSVNDGYTLSRTYPYSGSYTLTLLTITHYDSYDNLPSWQSGYTFDGTKFANAGYVQVNFPLLRGQVVAVQVKELDSTNWIKNVIYYDDKFRQLQAYGDNNVGGKDRMAKLLEFDGKVDQDFQVHTSTYVSSAPDSFYRKFNIYRLYAYDHADRLLICNKFLNGWGQPILDHTYNELGQLLTRKIHNYPLWNTILQTINYSYNIRNWLKGVNQPEADSANYNESNLFNIRIHYNTTSMNDAVAQYNGNISELEWKGGYDEQLRGNRYLYDKANRLTAADYSYKAINSGSESWNFSTLYNEHISGYDRNGNIGRMERWHGSLNKIDDLGYTYDGNRLSKIIDTVSGILPVGFTDRNTAGNDYQYDGNGNLTSDYNKNIDTITYNYLNLPDSIAVSGKGFIRFRYDATGNKLQKTVVDTTGGTTKITTYKYDGDIFYRNDTLESVNFDDGRTRPIKYDTAHGLYPGNFAYVWDHFITDHLGNVRMVINSQQKTDLYAATMETAAATKEEQLFTNLGSTRYAKPGGFDTNGGNGQVARLNGDINTSGNYRVGPSLVFKAMAGDTVSFSVKAWYSGSTQAPPGGLGPIKDQLVTLAAAGLVAAGGTHGGTTPSTSISSWLAPVIADFIDSTQSYDNSKPKAFLNWIMFGEDFNKVSSSNHMGAVQVPYISGGDSSHSLVGPVNMVVRRNGWFYVYVSNESNQNVYFDNLVINHKHGPVKEQTDYYAFGAEMPGLSSHAFTDNEYHDNRYKFNGIEETKELGLEQLDAFSRNLDPLVGRWWQIDPKPNKGESPYSAMSNTPVVKTDFYGDTAVPARKATAEDIKIINEALAIIAQTNPDIYATVNNYKKNVLISLELPDPAHPPVKKPVNTSTGNSSTVPFEGTEERTEQYGEFRVKYSEFDDVYDDDPSYTGSSFSRVDPDDKTKRKPIPETDANKLVKLVDPQILIAPGLTPKEVARVMAHEFGHAAYAITHPARADFNQGDPALKGHDKGNATGTAADAAEKQFNKNYKDAIKGN